MLNALVNRPNDILEKQKRIQAATEQIYYRVPRGKLYVRSYFGLFAVGMVATAAGMVSMVKGKQA